MLERERKGTMKGTARIARSTRHELRELRRELVKSIDSSVNDLIGGAALVALEIARGNIATGQGMDDIAARFETDWADTIALLPPDMTVDPIVAHLKAVAVSALYEATHRAYGAR